MVTIDTVPWWKQGTMVKIAEMQIMLQNFNKFSEVETYFRKLSF